MFSWCCLYVFLNGFLVNALLMLLFFFFIQNLPLTLFLSLSFFFFFFLYHNYMFNVLFLQTIIIHPEKYNLPLSRCEWMDIEWMSEGERRRKEFRWNQRWAPADLRILHYFTVYTHKWGYNETMIRCSRSRSLLLFAFYKYDMFLLLRSRLVVIITFFFTFFLWLLHCCSFRLYFV